MAVVRTTGRFSSGERSSGRRMSSWASLAGADAVFSWIATGAPSRWVSPVVAAAAAVRWAPASSASRSWSDSRRAMECEMSSWVSGRTAGDSASRSRVSKLTSAAAAYSPAAWIAAGAAELPAEAEVSVEALAGATAVTVARPRPAARTAIAVRVEVDRRSMRNLPLSPY
jgi:hypothetical protein